MRSIERRFRQYQEKDPECSTFLNFARAVRGQGFSNDAIGHWFKKLVDKDDYSHAEKRELLMYLRFISGLVQGQKEGETGSVDDEDAQV